MDLTKVLDRTTLPSSLQSLTFGTHFNQELDQVTLPSIVQSFTFGIHFNQILFGVTLPSSLQSLTFVHVHLNQRRGQERPCPAICKAWPLAMAFNQSLDRTTLPSSLQSLTFGTHFNQELDQVTLPSIVTRALPLAFTSTKSCSEWPCQAVFRPWPLALSLTRAGNKWPCQAVSKALASVRCWWAARDLFLIEGDVRIYCDILRIFLFELRMPVAGPKHGMNRGQTCGREGWYTMVRKCQKVARIGASSFWGKAKK